MRPFLSIAIPCLAFSACSSPQGNNAAKQEASNPSNTSSVAVNRRPITFKGLYTSEDGARTFLDCSGNNLYWVIDSASLDVPYANALKPLPYPNESVYAEVKGYFAGKAASGAAAEFPNVLVIKSLDKMEAKNFKTDCYAYEFIAVGNEPFWSVDIIPAEQRIILKDVGTNKVTIFPYQPANIGGGVYRFESLNEQKEKLVIIIREEKCSDGMSDRTYNYSAEVDVNGRTLKGCAIKKGE